MKTKLIHLMRWTIYLLISVFFGCLATIIYLDQYYASHCPKIPVRETGQIYLKYVNHGTKVYLNMAQLDLMKHIMIAIFILFILIASLGTFLNSKRRTNGVSPRKAN